MVGAIPPLVTSLLLAALLAIVWINADEMAAWATPFAETWSGAWRDLMRAILSLVLFAASVLISVLVFTTVTLLLGSPVYDVISEAVEDACGGVRNRVEYPARVWIPRMLGQSVLMVLQTIVLAVVVFGVGLIPVVGGALAGFLGIVLGGLLIARELVASPTERRGIVTLGARRRMLAKRTGATLGFGIPVYLLVSIPFVAIAVFPAAVAGGTILTRRLRGEPIP